MTSHPIYMDCHATTPTDKRVVEEMLPYFTEIYGNASSIDHEYGNTARIAIETARKKVAKLINARPEEIIFTSGATEADNMALIGIANQYQDKGNHIITCQTEHKAILDTCHYLEKIGFSVTYLPVNEYGEIDLNDLKNAIKEETILISLMIANNEIGTIHPVEEIGKIAHESNILFHTDAAQAVGHIPVDVKNMNIDVLSMSAHKFYGPKGVGAIYLRKIKPRVRLLPLVHGGGHERGFRSGTLNVPGIVGMGKAAELQEKEMHSGAKTVQKLRDLLFENLKTNVNAELNGHPEKRLPHNLNVYLKGIESKSLILLTKKQIAMSAGSACTSESVEPSHVLLAMGFDESRAHSSIRFGLSRFNTEEDIYIAVKHITESVLKIRKLSF